MLHVPTNGLLATQARGWYDPPLQMAATLLELIFSYTN